METRISLHAACRTLGLALRAALAWVLPRLCAVAVWVSQSAGQGRRTLTPWVLAHVPDNKKSSFEKLLDLAEDMGLEPTGLLHLTRIPSELLSHSVNPPNVCFLLSLRATYINLTQMVVGCKWNL